MNCVTSVPTSILVITSNLCVHSVFCRLSRLTGISLLTQHCFVDNCASPVMGSLILHDFSWTNMFTCVLKVWFWTWLFSVHFYTTFSLWRFSNPFKPAHIQAEFKTHTYIRGRVGLHCIEGEIELQYIHTLHTKLTQEAKDKIDK